MGFTSSLLAGLAQVLEDAGVGTWTPTGAYPAGTTTPIFIAQVPAAPDRLLTLTAYTADDDRRLGDSTIGVQIRARGDRDPRTADDLTDAVFDALHALSNVDLAGGAHLIEALRQSAAPLGPDANGRYETASNYYATVARPSTHRPD